MKLTRITLRIEQGRFEGREFVFTTPKLCLVGRSDDCDLQLPLDPEYANVSRHHCLFEIDPPAARVRDLGSRNGTYLNELNIGQRHRRQSPQAADRNKFAAYDLQDGDTVRVGSTVLRVGIAEAADISTPMSLPMYFV